MNNKDEKVNDYHTFKKRESYLEVLIEKTKINESEFKGFYNLIMSILIIYLFGLPFYNYVNYGYFIKVKLLTRMFFDFRIFFFVWPLFHFWTYFAFVGEKLRLLRVPWLVMTLFTLTTEIGIFFIGGYLCKSYNFGVSQLIFIVVQCVIHFFKMHSYTRMNRDYREDYLKKLSSDEKPIYTYPKNLNFSNFFYFLRAPVFVYEESYPRNDRINFNYFILKTLKAFFCMVLMYYVYTEHIESVVPLLLTSTLPELVIRLYIPIFVFCFVLFYLLFECVLPAYAELATFADRQFYDDWWNSTDMEEFNRRWNKLVHMFLHRHVYVECSNKLKLPRWLSKIITFLVSAFLHEFCLSILIGLIRPYMTIMMMFQIPLIHFGKKFLNKTTAGNFFFWFSLVVGNPLIFILYNRAQMIEYGHHM
jgi:hypothetical protein